MKIKPKYKMGQKVYLIESKKMDGRYNRGTIVGINFCNSFALSFVSFEQFIDSFKYVEYKVVYQDCFTNRFCTQTVFEKNLSKTLPE